MAVFGGELFPFGRLLRYVNKYTTKYNVLTFQPLNMFRMQLFSLNKIKNVCTLLQCSVQHITHYKKVCLF